MSVRTTVVGSWWPQAQYCDDLFRMHRKGMPVDEADSLLRSAAKVAIAEQRALGLAEWTGGEYFADEFLNHMQRVLTGIVIDVPNKEELFDYDDFGHAKITGTIAAPAGMGYLAAYLRERELPGGVRKATVVGPLEMTFAAMDQFEKIMAQLPNLISVVNAACPASDRSTRPRPRGRMCL